MLHQFAYFDLAGRIGLASGGVGPGAVTVRVDKAGLLGAHLQFNDGERVMWPLLQKRVALLTPSMGLSELRNDRPAVVMIDSTCPYFVQDTKVNNFLRIADFIGQTGIGAVIPPLTHQLKAGRVGATRAGMGTSIEKRLFSLLHRPRGHRVTALFPVQPGQRIQLRPSDILKELKSLQFPQQNTY